MEEIINTNKSKFHNNFKKPKLDENNDSYFESSVSEEVHETSISQDVP